MGVSDVQELGVVYGRIDDGPVQLLRFGDQCICSFGVTTVQAPDGVGRRSDDLPARRDGVFASCEAGVEDRAGRLGDLPELLRHP